ncbi:MAG: ATP-binding protein [Lachnospiraceae bacterium]
MFVGRETELAHLENNLVRVGNQITVVYGQKGVGKTTLIRRFLEQKKALYYNAPIASKRQHLFFLSKQMEKEGISLSEFPEYDEIFQGVAKLCNDKKILIIDEFQNMCRGEDDFFQQLIAFLESNKQLSFYVLLVSSTIGWVENSMIGKLGVLARAITGFYKIKELKFEDLCRFFKSYTYEECVKIYSILGGIPGLWRFFDEEYSFEENICYEVLSEYSALSNFGSSYLLEELRETSVYNTILYALSNGIMKLNDLFLYTGFSRAKISVYLKNLIQLEVVEKVFSYDTLDRSNSQKGVYKISHKYLNFYYKYIYGNQIQLTNFTSEEFFEYNILPSFDDFVSKTYCEVCAETIDKMNQKRQLPFRFIKSGTWHGKQGTIDFIGQDKDGTHTIIAQSNWGHTLMTYKEYELLLLCMNKAKIEADYIYLFSTTSFDESLKLEAKKHKKLILISTKQE